MTAIIVTSEDQSALRAALGEAITTFAVVSNIYATTFIVPPAVIADETREIPQDKWRREHFVDYLEKHPKLSYAVVVY